MSTSLALVLDPALRRALSADGDSADGDSTSGDSVDEDTDGDSTTGDEDTDAVADTATQDEACEGSPTFERPAVEPVTEGEGTVTIESPARELTAPAAPQRALGFYTVDVDTLLALGFPLNPTQPRRDGYTAWPCFFPAAELAGIETFPNYPEFNYEAVALAEPDLILDGFGHDPEIGELLSEIAPTYSYPHYGGEVWLTYFERIAEDFGRLDQYRAYVDFYEARLAEVRGEIEAATGAPTSEIVVASLQEWDQVQATCSYGVECRVFDDLGLSIHPLATTDGLAGSGGTSLSAEQLDRLADLDHAFVPTGLEHLAESEWLAGLAENPLWTQLPFVEAGDVTTYEWEMTFGGPSAQLAFLETVRLALTS
ncbi:MAG: ABC transporter substrate-binding protein [Actinomycetota bacterium]|nr:ABC transporter substrate-binding protein [Actinomycetota bacterium]